MGFGVWGLDLGFGVWGLGFRDTSVGADVTRKHVSSAPPKALQRGGRPETPISLQETRNYQPPTSDRNPITLNPKHP